MFEGPAAQEKAIQKQLDQVYSELQKGKTLALDKLAELSEAELLELEKNGVNINEM